MLPKLFNIRVESLLAEIVICELVTVTSHVSFAFGLSTNITVIVAFPTSLAVIFPFSSTVATSGWSELQATDESVAVSGDTVAVKVLVFPTSKIA